MPRGAWRLTGESHAAAACPCASPRPRTPPRTPARPSPAAPLAKLFTKDWEKEPVAHAICEICTGYLAETRPLMDGVWFDKMSAWMLACVTANYAMRLIAPEQVPKVLQVPFKGGLRTGGKVTDGQLRQLVADKIDIKDRFSRLVAHDVLEMTLWPLEEITNMLTMGASWRDA